ncbi:MAG: sensor domain-containing diguanylate cyclase [Candidatus Eisenbacteria sp.]|nr:sensor domain-containing diguanylate cyclase [Candidatus Eisenbacteria bacterium]
MRRRNGAGSRQLVDATEKFRKGQLKLIRVLEERGLTSEKESRTLSDQVDRAAAQKRSSDVLAAALTLNNKVARILMRENFGEIARQDSELEILFEVSRMTQTSLSKAEVFERLLDLIQQAILYKNATLFLREDCHGSLQPVACRGQHVDLIGGVRFDRGEGFSGWVATQKRPILLSELHRGRRPDDTIVGSFMSVPLVVQGELIGVLNLSHPRPKAFSEDHLRLLALIGGQAAATIQRLLLYEEMQRLATVDDLTTVYNRRHFIERLDSEIARARRYGVPFGLMFLDIDNFKELNDNFGHQVGDRILTELGTILKHWARSSDIVARYGGEEFIVLLPMTEKNRAMIAAERLRTRIQRHTFYRRKKLTVSVGVAGFAADGDTAEHLLGCVDEALYMAKNTGRNRICAFGEPVGALPAQAPTDGEVETAGPADAGAEVEVGPAAEAKENPLAREFAA